MWQVNFTLRRKGRIDDEKSCLLDLAWIRTPHPPTQSFLSRPTEPSRLSDNAEGYWNECNSPEFASRDWVKLWICGSHFQNILICHLITTTIVTPSTLFSSLLPVPKKNSKITCSIWFDRWRINQEVIMLNWHAFSSCWLTHSPLSHISFTTKCYNSSCSFTISVCTLSSIFTPSYFSNTHKLVASVSVCKTENFCISHTFPPPQTPCYFSVFCRVLVKNRVNGSKVFSLNFPYFLFFWLIINIYECNWWPFVTVVTGS